MPRQSEEGSANYWEGQSVAYFTIAQRLAHFLNSAINEGRVDESTDTGYDQLLNELSSGGFEREMVEMSQIRRVENPGEFRGGALEARNHFRNVAGG